MSIRRASMLLVALVMVAAGCKKKGPEPVTTPVGPPVNSVDVSLQVASVSPGSVNANQPASVQVIGSGFQPGSWVNFGPHRASTVQFMNANVLQVSVPPIAAGIYNVTVSNPDARQAVLRGGLRVSQMGVSVGVDRARCGLVTVYFDTDQASLPPRSRTQLDSMMDCYTGSTTPVSVLGHADERGTTDYNIALGQRRAEAVVDYLVRAGVPQGRLPVTSMGEERPVDRGHSEASWSKNRRVELILQ